MGNSYQIVAFDGTPVEGGAGKRVAVLKDLNTSKTFSRGKQIPIDQVFEYIDSGYLTALITPILTSFCEGVVVYKHDNFDIPNTILSEFGWFTCGNFSVTYMMPEQADRMFEEVASHFISEAKRFLQFRNFEVVTRLARQGLMVVPDLRNSKLAVDLYGVLFEGIRVDGVERKIKEEMRVILDGAKFTKWHS